MAMVLFVSLFWSSLCSAGICFGFFTDFDSERLKKFFRRSRPKSSVAVLVSGRCEFVDMRIGLTSWIEYRCVDFLLKCNTFFLPEAGACPVEFCDDFSS